MLEALIFSVVSALISLGVFGVQSVVVSKKVKKLGYKFNDYSNLHLPRRILVKVIDKIALLLEIAVKCLLPVANLAYIYKTLIDWNASVDGKVNSLLEWGTIIDNIEPVRQEIAQKPNRDVVRAVVEVINAREGRVAIIYEPALEEEQQVDKGDLNPEVLDRTEQPKVKTYNLRQQRKV